MRFPDMCPIYLQILWPCCSVWAMGPSEHQGATAAAAAFPSDAFRRAQGSQQKAWGTHCLHPGTSDRSFSSFFHSLPSLQPWMSWEWVGEAGGGKASCSTGDGSNQCLQVLCGCCALEEAEGLHSSWVSPPLTGFMLLSLTHFPITAEHHRPTLPQTFPTSLWPSCPRVPLIPLSHAFLSWNPISHLPQKKKAPPQC